MTSTLQLKVKPYTDDDITTWFKNYKFTWDNDAYQRGKVFAIRTWFNYQTNHKYKSLIQLFRPRELKLAEGYPSAYLLNENTNIGYLIWDIEGLKDFDIKESIWDERVGCYLTV